MEIRKDEVSFSLSKSDNFEYWGIGHLENNSKANRAQSVTQTNFAVVRSMVNMIK